jgi:hypothetical protein
MFTLLDNLVGLTRVLGRRGPMNAVSGSGIA